MFGPSRLPEFSSFPLVYPLWFFPEKKRNACGFAIALISRRKFCTRTHNFLSLAMVAIVDVEVASDGCLNFSPVRAKEASCRPVPTLWPASCTARTSTTRRAAVPTAETTKISARTPVWKTTSSISAIRWITFFFFFFFFFIKKPVVSRVFSSISSGMAVDTIRQRASSFFRLFISIYLTLCWFLRLNSYIVRRIYVNASPYFVVVVGQSRLFLCLLAALVWAWSGRIDTLAVIEPL